ncbi:MAG TPA: TIGR02757 family protein [Vicinamibacterales bacterium]
MPTAAAAARRERLAAALEPLYAAYNRECSATDPVELVRPYADPADREIAGFIAAGLAFGRVGSVMQSVSHVLAHCGPSPAAYVRAFSPERERKAFASFVHRWTRGADIVALLWVLRQMLDRSGSIEGFFVEGDDPSAPDVGPALDSFSARAMALDLTRAYGRVPARAGVSWFFPRPSRGSACKRLNLFLRWMVRRDDVDFGIWTRVSPSRLIVPLDTHLIRLGRCLRLTRRATSGWQMAAEITASLRAVDPHDPVRFDFSLCHVGMMGACGDGQRKGSRDCPLRGLCRPR